jgi:hypothetical protein
VIVQGAVRTREYERDGTKQRIVEVRPDTIGRLDRAERRPDTEANSDGFWHNFEPESYIILVGNAQELLADRCELAFALLYLQEAIYWHVRETLQLPTWPAYLDAIDAGRLA